jgi:hypothetical protein
MAPPYNQPFHYFRQDVEEYILLHRDRLSWRPSRFSSAKLPMRLTQSQIKSVKLYPRYGLEIPH